MRRVVTVIIVFLAACIAVSAGQRVELGNIADDVRITVQESNDLRTVIKYEIGAYTKQTVEIEGETYFTLNTGKENILHNTGEPALPRICRSIIIPDDARMVVNVLSSQYRDFEATPVAPSKGHLKRTVNPEDVPYTFGKVYDLDQWYPSQQAALREPYIMRDFRGLVVEIYPFQYNPSTKTLRVYTSIVVEVVTDGRGQINVFNRTEPYDKVNPDFELIYKQRFINYNQGTLLYTPVQETGDMLIITYDSFHSAMLPFVEWKNQKGIKTTIVDVSSIGNNSSLIANYIQSFYDSTELAWVLLVGDAAQVATPYASTGSSDPSYAKVSGGDNYPDIFIGRFSAETVAQVQTQVERTIDYEKYPPIQSWYNRATGIASDEGPGHHEEYDNQHEDLIRQDLLGYNYTLVDQIYEPSATITMISNALNNGRGLVNYTGHGSTTSWGTTGFSNTNVNALTNTGMLPFILSVACVNGNFDGNTCFAEAWLRATHNNEPSGAIATYMSSINQDWDPPMDAQDEATDLLVAEEKVTIGGLCYNGSCLMMDLNGSFGINMYNTWHIFGDPSVMLYTDVPSVINVSHVAAVIFTATQLDVTVAGVEGALCALYHDGVLYGSAYSGAGGNAVIDIGEALPIGQSLTLTVTAYNKQPYFGSVQVIAPEGAYVIYDEYDINDLSGNNNGVVDFGESILLGMQLQNVGPETAYDVSANLISTDPYLIINDGYEYFGTIAGDFGTVNITDAYAFDVSPNAPDGHFIPLHLEITGTSRDTWTGDFTIPVHAPVLNFAAVAVNDASGNGNGILEAGETAEVVVTLANDGSGTAYTVAGTLSESDDYVTLTDTQGTFGDLAPSGSGDNAGDAFTVIAGQSFPQGHSVIFDLDLIADGGYTVSTQFELRTAESFEYDNGGYTGSGNWQWGVPTYGPPGAYFGTKVWGTILGGEYQDNRMDDLIGPQIHIHSPEATLEFYHWYDIEYSYDGGNVAVSTNGGSTWSLITPVGGYPDDEISALNEPGYTDISGGWVRAEFSLADFITRDIMIRWRFGSDGMITEAGWYIDDVAVINNLPQPPPDLSYTPSSYMINLESGAIDTRSLSLTNDGDGPLYYFLDTQTDAVFTLNNGKSPLIERSSANQTPIGYHEPSNKSGAEPEPYYPPVITGQGGPDEFGYTWKDSNEPGGPTYDWVNITSIGTPIAGLGDDINTGPFQIGFAFEFYGNTYTTFRFSTNGFISFTSTASAYFNDPIPTGGDEPLNLVAAFWDDLNFNDGGDAYYYSNGTDSLIVSYVNVAHYNYGGPGPYTFQVILHGSGKIIFQYQDINPPDNSATIGIQNSTGDIGLQVVYNAGYVEENLAILFSPDLSWLSALPESGIVSAHSSEDITITFDAADLDDGSYSGTIYLTSNDPVNPEVMIPATLNVGVVGNPEITLSSQAIVDTLTEGEQTEHDIIIGNAGDAVLSVSFSSTEPWLLFDGGPYEIEPSADETMTLTLDASGLTPGEYSGSLDFSCNDSNNPTGSISVECLVTAAYSCEYVPGDVNGDGSVIGGDVTFAVNFFRGTGNQPPVSCFNEQTQTWLYVAGDVNSDCAFIGSDITYMVMYFRGVNPSLQFCPELPPSNPGPAIVPINKETIKTVK